MDFELTDFHRDICREARSLASRFAPDYWLEHDKTGEYPQEFVDEFARNDWFGLIIPEAYGGQGLGITEAALFLREVTSTGTGTSGAAALHFYMFPPKPLIVHGSERMKSAYLPSIAKGELPLAFGVTEPDSGVDTSRIRTRATKVPNGWLVNGRKIWISNAQRAERILLLARTEDRDPDRPLDGMTLFFAPLDRARCDIRKIDKLGRAAVDSNEIFIDDLFVADEDVIGEVGQGFRCLLDGLNPERIVIAAECIGTGRAALDLATTYAKERIVFDRPIGANQAIAHPLAQDWADLHAADLVMMHAAWLYDNNKKCGAEASAAKLLAADAAFKAADDALQVHGGMGYAKEYHIERLWREVRLFRVAPISQEMIRNFLAHSVLGLPRGY